MTKQEKWSKYLKGRYSQQAENARRRGVEWEFTYETWLELWAAELEERSRSGLYMCRDEDAGSYRPDNCYIGTPS